MKTILSLLLLFVSITSFSSGIEVFRSYDDYVNNKGESYSVFKGLSSSLKKYRIVVRAKGQNQKIKCEDIWGFKVDTALYRTNEKGLYMKLVSKGKLCYYENGVAYLSDGEFMFGDYNYVSATIESEMIAIPLKGSSSHVFEAFQQFKQRYPECSGFYDCIAGGVEIEPCRDCIYKFENPNKPRVSDALKEYFK